MSTPYGKYNRSDYMAVGEVSSCVLERDMLLSNWELFTPNRGCIIDYIKPIDIQAPDILSIRIYSRMDWWWIISKYNNIDDWWNDVYVGMRIKIPNAEDIKDFYNKVRNKTRT